MTSTPQRFRLAPEAKLASLLAFGILLPWQPAPGLLVAGLVVAVLLILHASIDVLHSLRRIRWLLLSLAILYLFFTPGVPLLPWLGDASPTQQGLLLAIERGAVLCLMLLTAVLVLRSCSRDELAIGMQRLLLPLVRLRLLPAHFPTRLALVFDALDNVDREIREARRAGHALDDMATIWNGIEQRSERPSGSLPDAGSPRATAFQWLLPVGILLAGGMLLQFS